MSDIQPSTNNLPATVYKPSEIIGIFNSILAKQSVNAQVVHLRGIYLASGKQPYSGCFYDTLRDEDRQEEITIIVTQQQRDNLKNGNLVNVGGVIGRSINSRGQIQINLNVSRIEIVQEQVVDETEIRRAELRQKKASAGFKRVDGVLEQLLFQDKRPNVALVFAQSSITMSDFEAGINAAKSAIDFVEHRVNFANSSELVKTLKYLDELGFSVIVLVRGGGGGIEKLDDIDVLETVVNLKTPTIAAIGHVEEKLFIKQVVDKCAPTPNGLGQYFSDLVEDVSEKKTKSRAVLTEQIKKQFKDQLDAGQKQNKELQEKLQALTKNQESAQKLHKEQMEAATKQNQELQKKLGEITKANESAQKLHKEQMEVASKQNQELQKKLGDITKTNEEAQKQQCKSMEKLQAQMKAQAEAHTKAQQGFSESLKKLQDTNTELNKSITTLTSQNVATTKELNDAQEQQRVLEQQLSEARKDSTKRWLVIIIAALVIALIWAIIR